MTDTVLVAVISAFGLILSGVLVELVRNRRQQRDMVERQQVVVSEVTPNGGKSLRDAIDRLAADMRELRGEVGHHGERIAAVEALLTGRANRRSG